MWDLLPSRARAVHRGSFPRSVCEAKLKLRAGGEAKITHLVPPFERLASNLTQSSFQQTLWCYISLHVLGFKTGGQLRMNVIDGNESDLF